MATIFRNVRDFIWGCHSIDPTPSPLKNGRGLFLNHVYKNNGFHQRIKLQTPQLRAPFGLSTWTQDGDAEKHTLSLNLAAVGDNEDEVKEFYQFLERLDAVIITHIHENQLDLFPHLKLKGQRWSRDFIHNLYGGYVRPASNPDFPPQTRIKVQEIFGKMPSVYDAQKMKITLDKIPRGSHVVAIVDLGSVWVSSTQITASLRLVQLQVLDAPQPPALEEDVFMFESQFAEENFN
jgi:hypothetical protein